MATRLLSLFRELLIVSAVLLMPVSALSQDENAPVVSEQTKTADAQDEQKPAESAPPPQGEMPEAQSGQVIVPPEKIDESGPEKTVEPAQAAPDQTKGDERSHLVKKGDTLWDISNAFLKDPFLWPFIWKANPFITNPDLIYPGNRLAIPDMAPVEQALAEPVEEERAAPAPEPAEESAAAASPPASEPEEEPEDESKLVLPEEAPAPIIDKYSMLNAGFINAEDSKDRIVGSLEKKSALAYDDIAFVTIKSRDDAAVGDRFIIYTPLHKVRHPVTKKHYGKLVKVLGVLKLIEKGESNTFAARITLSFDAIGVGSMLTPYHEPTLIYETPSEAKIKDISGYILEVLDTRTINATTDIVYLDKGSADGVDPGDRFIVYGIPQKKEYPKPVIGETQVFLVKEHTSTAVVRKSSSPIGKGDWIEFRKQ